MTLFRFCHAQKNALAFFVALTFREIAVGLRGLDFRLPVAPCSIDRLLMIFPLCGHAALKRKKCRLPHENCQFSDNRWSATCRPQRAECPRSPKLTCGSVRRRSYRTVEGEREHVARRSRHIAGLAPDN